MMRAILAIMAIHGNNKGIIMAILAMIMVIMAMRMAIMAILMAIILAIMAMPMAINANDNCHTGP